MTDERLAGGSMMLGNEGRRYMLLWCIKGDEDGGVKAMEKYELCENVLEVRMNEILMAIVFIF